MPTSIPIRLSISVCFLVFCITLCCAVSIAFPQDFQFDESGEIVAYTNCERHDLTVLSYTENVVILRLTIADLFRDNSWSPLNSINPIPQASFRQLSFPPKGEFIAFRAEGIGECYSGIFNVKFKRTIGLHFGGSKTFEFSPDGKWLVTSEIGGNSLIPFREYPNFRPVLRAESSSFYFSQDCKLIAMCMDVDVQNGKQLTEIQIFQLPNEAEVVKQVRNNAKVELELIKQFRYEGHARDLRFSPDNNLVLWKGWPVADVYGNRPFMARIHAADSQVQEIKIEDELKFWGDVCFAGTESDYFILAQKTGEIDGKNRVSIWRKPLDLKTPAQLVVSKPGSCSYPIEVNNAGTHALVPIEITTGGGLGFYSDAEAASFGGSQIFLIDLANIKEVRGFSQDGRHVKFNPAKPTVVMRVGDRFSEYDLTGNPVANDELPTTPEARTKR